MNVAIALLPKVRLNKILSSFVLNLNLYSIFFIYLRGNLQIENSSLNVDLAFGGEGILLQGLDFMSRIIKF